MSKNLSLGQFQKNLKNVSGQHKVSFAEIFDSKFMRKYTNFSSFEQFLESGNFVVNSQKDFEAIPDADMDIHVRKVTRFSSWKEMLTEAAKQNTLKKLGF